MTDQVIQHAGRGHSELGPSSSERWLKCTPSAVLSAQFQDKPSVYAEEGTFLHELCEMKLHRYLGDMTKDVLERQYAEHRDNDFYSDEAEEVTDVYVNHCIEVIEAIRAFESEHPELKEKFELINRDIMEIFTAEFGMAFKNIQARFGEMLEEHRKQIGSTDEAHEEMKQKLEMLAQVINASFIANVKNSEIMMENPGKGKERI